MKIRAWLLIAFGYVLATACATTPSYQHAVLDAEAPTPDKVSHHLTVVSPKNPNLYWRNQNGDDWVLVTTWNNWPEYQKQVGHDYQLKREVWVTAVPDVRKKCEKLAKESSDLDLRLKELLGLPATKNYTNFAEFWVRTHDLFRPCANPAIDTDTCGLDMPQDVPPEYRDWFKHQVESSYGPKGYPWTQLGYTYDWGARGNDHFGVSEFVVRAGSTVKVKAVYPTTEYCH